MSQYLEYPVAHAVVLGKNRRGVLIGFGVTAIVLGLIAVLWMGYVWFSIVRFMNMGTSVSYPPRFIAQLVMGTIMALIASALLAWGGVAMMRCRRWVAPLGL